MKKLNISKRFFAFGTVFLLSLGLANSLQTNQQSFNEKNDNIKVLSIDNNLLSDDVESLDVSVNLTNKLFNYDITFKTNAFDNQQTNSFFFWTSSTSTDLEWDKFDFGTKTTIINRHASDSASYEKAFTDGWITTYNDDSGTIQFGIKYGAENYATKNSIEIEAKSIGEGESKTELYNLPKENVLLKLNEDKTFAQITFFMEYDVNRLELDHVYLKSSKDDSVNLNLFKGNDINLIQGTNKFTLQLGKNYHYHDLYLEFSFNDEKIKENGIKYFINSNFNSDSETDFQSGIPSSKWQWGTKEVITFVFIILFIIIILIVLFVIILQIKKRKRLENEQAEQYYDQNLL